MPWRRNPVLTGAGLIAAERQRQIDVEGWTPEHDAEHGPRQGARGAPLVRAAIAYLDRNVVWWPWGREYWKPARTDSAGDRVRELVKAGALIAAEIDRLQLEAGDVAELLAGAIDAAPVATPPDEFGAFSDSSRLDAVRAAIEGLPVGTEGQTLTRAFTECIAAAACRELLGPVATPTTPPCSQRASHRQLVQPCPECGFRPDWLRAATPAPALPFPGTDEVAANVALSDETVVEEEATPPTCGHGIDRAHDLRPTPWERSRCPGPVATPTEPDDPTYGRIDPDIQRAVDALEPESIGSRVAMENTLQARRDAATPTEPAPAAHLPSCRRPGPLCLKRQCRCWCHYPSASPVPAVQEASGG